MKLTEICSVYVCRDTKSCAVPKTDHLSQWILDLALAAQLLEGSDFHSFLGIEVTAHSIRTQMQTKIVNIPAVPGTKNKCVKLWQLISDAIRMLSAALTL